MSNSGAVIVSWDFSNGGDNSVLIVGRKTKGQVTEVINAFQGREAEQIQKLLTTEGLSLKTLAEANNVKSD